MNRVVTVIITVALLWIPFVASANSPPPLDEILKPELDRKMALATQFKLGTVFTVSGGVMSAAGLFVFGSGVNEALHAEDSNFVNTSCGLGFTSSCEDTSETHRRARNTMIIGGFILTTGMVLLIIGLKKIVRARRGTRVYQTSQRGTQKKWLSLRIGSSGAQPGLSIQF